MCRINKLCDPWVATRGLSGAKSGAYDEWCRPWGHWPSQGSFLTAPRGRPGRDQNRWSEAISVGFSCKKLQGKAFRLDFCVFFLNQSWGVNVAAAWEIMMFFIHTRSWQFRWEKYSIFCDRANSLEIWMIFLTPLNRHVRTCSFGLDNRVAKLL